jgi:cytochrome c oxidase assembly protein subunit 15
MYKKLIYIAILWTLLLIMLGAYVRLSDAGLGCPDWPGCYGHMMVPASEQALEKAKNLYPLQPVEAHKAWKEMVHRYAAGGLGVLIMLIGGVAIFKRHVLKQGIKLPLLLVATLFIQAALGMWTVTLLLKPAIVTAHLLGGMATLALLVLLYTQQHTYPGWQNMPLQRFALLTWALLLAQITLGGWVSSNYAALACYDFPACQQGVWIPSMDFTDAFHIFRELGMRPQGGYLSQENLVAIHWLHRVGAVVVSVVMLGLIIQLIRYRESLFWGVVLLMLLMAQIMLGIGNVVFSLPLLMAVAHNGVAAGLLATLTLINGRLWQVGKSGRKDNAHNFHLV